MLLASQLSLCAQVTTLVVINYLRLLLAGNTEQQGFFLRNIYL